MHGWGVPGGQQLAQQLVQQLTLHVLKGTVGTLYLLYMLHVLLGAAHAAFTTLAACATLAARVQGALVPYSRGAAPVVLSELAEVVQGREVQAPCIRVQATCIRVQATCIRLHASGFR